MNTPSTDYSAKIEQWFHGASFRVSAHTNTGAITNKSDCELLIFSNSGARYAKIGHAPKPPDQTPSKDELIKMKVDCFIQVVPGPRKWLQAHWLIDPPPYETIIDPLRLWEVVAREVGAHATVELAVVGARGDFRPMAKITAGANGQATFRFTTRKGESIAVSANREMDDATLFVGGAMLEPVARFVPHKRAVDATVIGAGQQARVAIMTADDVMLFGLDGQSFGRAAFPDARQVQLNGQRITVDDGARIVEFRPAAATASPKALTPIRTQLAAPSADRFDKRSAQFAAAVRHGGSLVADRAPAERDAAQTRKSSTWLAEPWMRTPIRVGRLAARLEGRAVAVYRYVQTQTF